MKPSRLLPALACFLAAGSLGQAPLRAADDDQAAHKAAAEEVLKAMHMDTVFAATSERMMTAVDRISDGAARQLGNKPEAADFQTRMHAQTREMLKKQFNWEELRPEFIKSYEDTFSTQELKDLTVFYNSPVGQKLVAKQPELSERMSKVSQERVQQVLPLIVNMVRTESAKIQGPGASAPGAPGMFPVPPAPPALGKLPVPPTMSVPPAPPMLPVPPAPASGTPATSSASTPSVNPAPKGTP